MHKYIPIVIASILLILPLFAANTLPKYKGSLQMFIDKEEYFPGDTMSIKFVVSNQDEYVISNGEIVFEILKGCKEPVYPSQLSDCDNVFDEIVIPGINIGPGDQKTIFYNYSLPENLMKGDYRIDAYFEKDRTPMVGIPFIFASPVYRNFKILGDGGDFPNVKILRTRTVFKGSPVANGSWNPEFTNFQGTDWPWISGPVGVLVTPEMKEIEGRIYLENDGNREEEVNLNVLLCWWTDIDCNPVSKFTKRVILNPDEQKIVNVSLRNPEHSGAYAIRIEVRDLNNKLLSLYRNRAIVQGPTAVIRKLSVNKPYIEKENKVKIQLVVGTSPDHYTTDKLGNLTVSVAVRNAITNFIIFEKSFTISSLSKVDPVRNHEIEFTSEETLNDFIINSKIYNRKGELYDNYSIHVISSDFAGELDTVTLTWNYWKNESLMLELCAKDKYGLPLSAKLQGILMGVGNNSLIKSFSTEASPCGIKTLDKIPEGSYLLQINSYKQFNFPLYLEVPLPESEQQTGIKWWIIAAAIVIILIVIIFLSVKWEK